MRRQRGWAGILMLLVVVLIVAVLAKDALLKYLGPAAVTPRATAPAQSGTVGDASPPPAATTPLDRARAVQDMMQKESAKRGEE